MPETHAASTAQLQAALIRRIGRSLCSGVEVNELFQSVVETLAAILHANRCDMRGIRSPHRWACSISESSDADAVLSVPLQYQHTRLGQLVLQRRDRPWMPDEIEFVETIADQCAVALHTATMQDRQAQLEMTNRALAAIPDLIIRLTRGGIYLDIIPAKTFKTLFPSGNLRGKHLSDVLPPDLVQERLHYIRQALQTGTPQLYTYAITIEGEQRFEEARITVLDDDEVLLLIRDITKQHTALQQRQQAEAALHHLNQELERRVEERTQDLIQSEEQFRRIFDSAPIALSFAYLKTRRIVRVNAAHRDLFGYSDAELAEMTFLDFTHPADVIPHLRLLQQLNDGVIPRFQLEKRFFKRNGELIWALITVTLFRDRAGTPPYTLAMIEDITNRKQADDRLKASLAEKEVLLKEVHHRVKNNLQTISSLLKLQASTSQNLEVQSLLQESQNRVRTMALIHEQIYRSPELARVQFGDYVRKLVTGLFASYNMQGRQIELQLDVDAAQFSINTAIPCGLILNELVSNALKHAFPGNRPGSIRIRFAQNDRNQYVLTVQDNGVGIDGDVDLCTTSSLGLQLVYSLVRQLHGAIELDHTSGSTFTITFPIPD
ncbi:PAS domain S-box protein [Leptolyngbya sp. FACHB-36]|uniref:histidine kinase dimerization/phosphoacceptor domain -containing protein n=1 Tax=Leptolyngbya sp. FACHB-36 TaxID=2692808 RepID=UPI0016801783|nr:histidine kinase dimerization/phosphoacceptor domain -containing protein [Leptolyngbya sp. FACHB-36]MBD2020021.1 PAS domain S-box protein [Leptolyngbya sp. FACHB-36]